MCEVVAAAASGRMEGVDEGRESEEEMDGGTGRDVRKLWVQEVF